MAAVLAAHLLNLVGIIVPGEKVPPISGRFVSFHGGVAVDDRQSHDLFKTVERAEWRFMENFPVTSNNFSHKLKYQEAQNVKS
jgi:hypothetical protein